MAEDRLIAAHGVNQPQLRQRVAERLQRAGLYPAACASRVAFGRCRQIEQAEEFEATAISVRQRRISDRVRSAMRAWPRSIERCRQRLPSRYLNRRAHASPEAEARLRTTAPAITSRSLTRVSLASIACQGRSIAYSW